MDRRIQKYIRAKEKLIALLDEYKQGLIHQAVTGQIDVRTGEPYPDYKESGVEWIAEGAGALGCSSSKAGNRSSAGEVHTSSPE